MREEPYFFISGQFIIPLIIFIRQVMYLIVNKKYRVLLNNEYLHLRKCRAINGMINCWEFKKCGRIPELITSEEHDVCPVTTATYVDGINRGKNGGRICWSIAGTFSDKGVLGKFAAEKFSCVTCDFFNLVNKEENLYTFELLTPEQMNTYKSKISGSRKNVRFDVHLDIEIKLSKKGMDYIVGVTKNFSRGGLCFVSEDFKCGSHKTLEFIIKHPRKHKSVIAPGDVIWKKQIRDRCEAGIAFIGMDKETKNEILKYVYEIWINEMEYP